MHSPNCPDHGRLVLDLALGRLDDAAAIEAENVGASCPVCRAWWQGQFEGGAAEVVDEAVAAAFAGLRLPARRRGFRWMAAAAAVVVALAVGTIWVSQSTTPVAETPASRMAAIRTITFEPSEAAGAFALIEAPDPEPADLMQAVVREASSGAPVVAEAVQAEVAAERPAGILFAGGFESGRLEDWVPKT